MATPAASIAAQESVVATVASASRASLGATAEFACEVLGAVLVGIVGIVLLLHGATYVWMRLCCALASFRLGNPFVPQPPPSVASPNAASAAGGADKNAAAGTTKLPSPLPPPSSGVSPSAALSASVSAGTPASSTISGTQPLVVITGGGMGIGRELAERYGKLGYHVVIWDVMPAARMAGVLEELRAVSPPHARIEAREVDVSDDKQVANAAGSLERRRLIPDLLILNAGIVTGRRIVGGPEHLPRVRKLLDVNVYQLYNVSARVVPRMVRMAMKEEMASGKPRHRGVVVVGSVAGFVGTARMADYNASKAAANIFAEALAAEIRQQSGGSLGLRVTLVCPYQISTGMFAGTKTIRFFNELTPTHVADAIVEGVRLKKRLIVLPYILFFYLALKVFLPWSLIPLVDAFLGGSAAMQTFRGRDSRPGEPSSPEQRPATPPPPPGFDPLAVPSPAPTPSLDATMSAEDAAASAALMASTTTTADGAGGRASRSSGDAVTNDSFPSVAATAEPPVDETSHGPTPNHSPMLKKGAARPTLNDAATTTTTSSRGKAANSNKQ